MKRLLILLICLSLVFCLAACSNDDGSGDTSTDTDTSTSTETQTDTDTSAPQAQEITYTAVIKDQDGYVMAGAVLWVCDEDDNVVRTYTANDQGEVSFTVVKNVGVKIKIDSDSLPEFYYFDADYIALGEETALDVEVKNNTPNGTFDRPFAIEDTNELVIEAGATVYYVIYGGSNRNFALSGANGVLVTFNGEAKTVEQDGTLEFKIPQIDESNRGTIVVFENTNEAEATLTLTITSDPGAHDNPFELELGTEYEHVLLKEETVYYKWVADKTGYFAVYSESVANNLTIYNQTSYEVTEPSAGGVALYISVTQGDEIMLYVSSTSKDNYNEVIFEANCYEGTDEDPIPVYVKDTAFLFDKGQELTFAVVSDGSCVLEIISDYAKLTVGETEYLPNEITGIISEVQITEQYTVITVANTDEGYEQEILISLYYAVQE